ncbi:LysR family transcriptional regulator [Parahaliea mediterranea]|uniref:LysR family transcriptional regulator n=1 Tax=Parahaliea mediterranea TaxID=651086 RepID=UPI000E2E9B70|nr:LysR family transcriptional regulator [Parahaliea mediterranea]
MPIEPTQYPALAWFYHIARHCSITRAAAELGVSRAALSQQLKALEQHLGVRLMHRTTRHMSLTDEGQRLFDALKPALGAIELAVSAVGQAADQPTGVLRISTSRVASRLLLEPHLATFLGMYPSLGIELIASDGLSNIVFEGVDAGIRLGESLNEHMVAVPVTPAMEMAVVASPAYLQAHGEPRMPSELAHHHCMGYRFSSSGAIDRWQFTSPEDGGAQFFEPKGRAVFNDDDSMLSAALQGLGVIKHLDLCIKKHLDDGSLVRVLRPWCKPFPGFYLYVPSRAQLPAKTRALIDFLVEQRSRFV